MTGKVRKMRGRRIMPFRWFGYRNTFVSKTFNLFQYDLVLLFVAAIEETLKSVSTTFFSFALLLVSEVSADGSAPESTSASCPGESSRW